MSDDFRLVSPGLRAWGYRLPPAQAGFALGDVADCGGTVDGGVDVAGAGDFEAGEARKRAEGDDDFPSDDLRSFAEGTRELKGDGSRQFAELEVGWNLDGDGFESERVVAIDDGAEVVRETFLEAEIHARKASKSLIYTGDSNRGGVRFRGTDRDPFPIALEAKPVFS